ncbi:MAG TPA: GatB/YqeY domain-containing protein [Bacteroidia bacterium]|nr:GatB/YqeY domain-containing protein [Bacteroidia bacterium]
MMIEEKLNADIKTAMLARDAKKLDALRAMKSVVLLLKTSPEGLTEESATKALQKEVKKRRETADIYTKQNRTDLAEVEIAQADVIEAYLPKQMSAEELKTEVEKIIAQVGATTPADMGKVMGAATKALAGKADGKAVSDLVKQLLTK